MRARPDTGIRSGVYIVRGGPSGVSLSLGYAALEQVEVVEGELRGPGVTVRNRCVLVERGPDGDLRGIPMEPIAPDPGRLDFEPRAGGARTRENRRASGARNPDVAEATRFGMVNAYYHADIATRRWNELLADLGSAPLPRLDVVVAAHAGSQLPGFCQGDGDFRRGHMLPFSGGHYRVSQITSGVPERFPVSPNGEVHLGPGRRRQPFAGHDAYLANAAHNPATIYHEVGHHACRHTADFRLNAERRPAVQRNGKMAMEEGFCDYVAASMLGTGRPYSWFRPALGARRDPDRARKWVEECAADAHAEGALWASGLWRTREHLANEGLVEPDGHDRAVAATLLRVGSVGRRDGRRRREREAERCAPSTVLAAYLESVREAGGSRAADRAARVCEEIGLFGLEELTDGAPAC